MLLTMVFVAAAAVCFSIEVSSAAFILIGMLLGTVLRDVGFFRRWSFAWPVVAGIIDWDTLEEILASNNSSDE